ncbi:MAG: hypothetical protein ACI9SG_003031 [Maribacter sp.]|jgi:hypothetical protein
MKVLAIEVMSNAVGMLLIDGNQKTYSVINLGKPLSIPKEDTSIKNIIAFQADFATHLQNQTINRVVLCEGGNDSKKMRVRMEFAILSECEKQAIDYTTYPTGSCTRLINSTYKKDTGREFSDELTTFKLPKYMSKSLAAGWRFLE